MMSKFTVIVVFVADASVELEAKDAAEAIEKVWEHDRASPSLCHQCSQVLNFDAEPIRVEVLDEDGDICLSEDL